MGKGKRTLIERQDLILMTLEIIKTTLPFSSGGKFSSEIQRQKSVGNGVEAFREKSRKHRFQIDGIATGRTNGLLIWNGSKFRDSTANPINIPSEGVWTDFSVGHLRADHGYVPKI